MKNNDYILDAVKGEPGSLTSIAFNTGVISERARIIKLLNEKGSHEWDDGHEPRTCITCWNIAFIVLENK